jgi:hypothetical protein
VAWWLPLIGVAVIGAASAGLRQLARRKGRELWRGLAVLRSLNGGSRVLGFVLAAVFAQIFRNWLLLHAVGVDASFFDAIAVLIAVVTLGQLPVGTGAGAAAAVLILGRDGVAAAAAAGVLMTVTGTVGGVCFAASAGGDRLWSRALQAWRAARARRSASRDHDRTVADRAGIHRRGHRNCSSTRRYARSAMLIDRLMPEFDATRIEHRVVAGRVSDAYAAASPSTSETRSGRAMRCAASSLFAQGRSGSPRCSGGLVRRSRRGDQRHCGSLTSPSTGNGFGSASSRPDEIAFGAIGRFWAGETVWAQIDASDFAAFARPG